MKKSLSIALFILVAVGAIFSCKKEDDGFTFVPARDRGEEAPVSTAIIEEYLETHFYNYEEFDNPPAGFDFKIKFDTIAGDNADKIPLMQQVSSKTVVDRVDMEVTYKLYYLNALEGGGEYPKFPDIVTLTYEGTYLNTEFVGSPYTKFFDSAVTPINFDLTNVVNGFQDGVIETRTSPNPPEVAGDGSISFTDYGVGAVFIPSGLGYYVSPPSSSAIPFYAQLIFTYQVYLNRQGDQDNDGIPSILEDLNMNQIEEDDDTDENGLPNFFDADDDGDGRPTSEEIVTHEYILAVGDDDPTYLPNEVEISRTYDEETMETTIRTVEFTDTNGNGTPDYLDDTI